jgi:hypothetical protein
VSVHGNPNYLASEKIGYPKDPMQRNVELLVGLGFYKDVERDPPAAELPLPQRYTNGERQLISGTISLGTPAITAQILRNSIPRSDPSTTVFEPAQTVAWMVNPKNTGGFENFKTPFSSSYDGRLGNSL